MKHKTTARGVSHLLAALVCGGVMITAANAQSPPGEAATGTSADSMDLFAVKTCPQQDLSHEAVDQRTVGSIMSAGQHDGFSAIGRHRADLEAILAHAPACYPQVERRDTRLIVRSIDPQAGLTMTLALTAMAQTQTPPQQVSVAVTGNTYPLAALLLGSYLNELHAYPDAIAVLDRGLAMQPSDQYLVTEKVASLVQLHRQQEAADMLQALLADESQAIVLDRGRVERILGETLIDLNRLDEAEAALRESIRVQPQNPNAQHELDYIAGLRSGGAHSDAQLTTSPAPPPSK